MGPVLRGTLCFFCLCQILHELLLPKGYRVRLYVLQGMNLTPMDLGIGGRPGKSDPYVMVKLGKEVRKEGGRGGSGLLLALQ